MKSKKCSSNQDVPFERYAVQAGVRINLNTPWEEVLHLAVRYEVSKGNVIQLTREMEEDFYYLSQGSICLQILTSNGRENTSNHVHKGCLFNFVSAFVHDDEEDFLWLVLEDAVFWRFPGGLLHDEAFVRRYPHLIINIMRSMSLSITMFHTRLSRLAVSSTLCLVCQHIIGLANAADSLDFAPNVTQEEVANELGIHRGTLCAEIRYLKESGIIGAFCKKRLLILDIDRLYELARL